MCSGIVEGEDVAGDEFREDASDGELVVVLAEGAGDIIDVVAGAVFLAEDGDVVVCAVEGGAHEVGHAGVHSCVVAVGVLDVEDA